MIKTHPERLSYRVVLQPGPSAGVCFIKAIETMTKEGLLTENRTTTEVGGRVGASALVLPGALLARGDLEAKIKYTTESLKDQTREKRVRVEYGELRRSIETDRSAYLYLIALQQAITSVRYSTPDETKKLILGDIMAEAVLEIEPR